MTHAVGLPRGWAETQLGEIRVDLSRTLDPRRSPDEYFELYSVPSFAEGLPEIAKGSAIGSAKMTLSPGTVVVCKINPRINRVWVVGNHSPHQKVGSGEWIPFFPVPGVVPTFLAYYLRRDDFRNFLASRVSGVGGSLMRVRPSTLDEYPLPIPSTSEQQRIVGAIESFVTRLDNAVALLERVQKNLKRYRASVLKAAVEGYLVPTEAELARREGRSYEPASELLKRILAERKARWIEVAAEKARAKAEEKVRKADQPWTAEDNAATLEKERAKAARQYQEPPAPDTSDLPALPEGWEWCSLGTIASIRGGYAFRSADYTDDPAGVPLVRQSDLRAPVVNTDGAKRLPASFLELYGREYLVRQGDVLVGLSGSLSSVSVYVEDKPALQNQRTGLLRISELVAGGYVQAVYRVLVPSIEEAGKGVAVQNVAPRDIEAMSVSVPPLAEQERILTAIDSAWSVVGDVLRGIEASLARTQRLRQSILRWAFEGKLVEQDPNDEPASVLLERIRAGRAAAEAPKGRGKRRSAE
jgi:type I restriction enzyme S subunit